MLASSVKTARAWHGGDFSQFFEDYKQTLAYRTPLDRDVRSLFINYVLTSPTNLSTARPDDVNEFLKSIIANSQANTEYNRNDYFILMLHAQLLELYGSAANDQKMIEEALTTINRAIANGGEHTPARLIKSDILSLLKRNSEIPPIYREVLALRPDYKVVFCPLAVAELDYGYQVSQEDFWKNFDNCLDYGNVKVLVRSADLSKAKKHYSDLRDQIRLKKLQTVAK
jgi:tetratricopeptide (TPR) repeat protein